MSRKTSVVFSIASLLLFGLFLNSCSTKNERKSSKQVILIGIDGMGVTGFEQANTPYVDKLVRNGALSLKTRGVMPTVSGPNWSSHLLGAGPEQHGITSNGWTKDNYTVDATVKDENGFFPSVFSVIREKRSEALTGFFYDWDALANFYNVETINKVVFSKTYQETFEKATPWIIENNPDFSFIYIGHPDEVGHEHKWYSPEYFEALEEVDEAVGVFLNALENAGLINNFHFIIVTDHGGVEYGHGGLSMEEIQVPWIISGPGVVKDRIIEQPNNVFNTASTILYILDIEQPDAWIGKPVYGAFAENPVSRENTNSWVAPPISSAKSGIYSQSIALEFNSVTKESIIRFTRNGELPDENARAYSKPLLLLNSSKIIAMAFERGYRSRPVEVNFILAKAIENIDLLYSPSAKYSGEGNMGLGDFIIASADFKDGKWLGFEENDVNARITLSKPEMLQKVSIGFLNNPGSWIFPPEKIDVFASVDNINFKKVGSKILAENINELQGGRNLLSVNITPAETKYIKVVASNIGFCPEGHPGQGKPAWLFVDEIIIE
ncbi:MAG: alkaline phosphatase [Bacteroidales bacterium]|nr:alkaline phosphatase [Bacteroidales bacterium]